MNNDWLDIDVLEDYLDGKLDAKGMHFVEKQALEDPFVAEALEGLRQSPKRKQTFSILQKQLHDRIAAKPIKRKLWGITTQRLSIAATATVAFIAVSILFFMREINHRNEVASRKAEGVIVNLDTNTAIATNELKQKDSAIKTEEGTKAALIDQAIVDAKSGSLAKNNKAVAGSKLEADPIIRKSADESEAAPMSADVPEMRKAKPVAAAAPEVTPNTAIYSGTVSTDRSGLPVSGATVKIAGAKNETKTDANGNFYLQVDSTLKNKDLVVKADGYKELSVSGAKDPNAIKIALSGDLSLNELAMITGSSRNKKESISAKKVVLYGNSNLERRSETDAIKPMPVSTIDYEKYLELNNKLYNPKGPEQYVILSFKISKSGRPGSIKVVKSLNKEADAEAKRLVEKGPDWVLPKNGNNLVELSIKF